MFLKRLYPGLFLLGLVATFIVPQAVYIVPEWQQAIVLQFGQPVQIAQQPGLYYKLPVIQSLIRLERRVLVVDVEAGEYLSLDKKRLMVGHVSRWQIIDPLLFYRTMRDEPGAVARLNDLVSARLRQEIAKHNFIDIVREKREQIMAEVTLGVHEQAATFGIRVLDVRIKRLDLPSEVQASVFARMVAERERIAKRYRAEGEERALEIRATADKEREIILATAYADSQRLRGEGDAQAAAAAAAAFGQDHEFYAFLRRLEAYEQIFSEEAMLVLHPDSDLLRYLETPHLPPSETELARK